MKPLLRQMRRFRDQEDGLVLTEFLIMLPLLVWAFVALFVYWDAFRTINLGQKAAYSVSDLISRQSEIDTTFVNGMQDVTEYLLVDAPDVRIRITSVKYKEEDNKLYVLFSRSPGNKMPALSNASVNSSAFRARIPMMADQDSVVVVETEVDYTPGRFKRKVLMRASDSDVISVGVLDVGIPPSTFRNFVVTRPRYYLQVCFKNLACPSII